ncbi:MAG: N-acetylmuramoyl-L-alanine amidase [Algiphilus sp.]
MRIRNHRLYDDHQQPIAFRRSPNQSAGTIQPRYLVMHYTAGRDMDSSVHWFENPNANASAHLVIGRDGRIVQMVAFNRKAWHAGRSHWEGISGLNGHSIGIELDNHGQLEPRPGGWGPWFDPETTLPAADCLEAVHPNGGPVVGWHCYTSVQLAVAMSVASLLVAKYGLVDVLGHEDIAPDRKTDPGPAFPMQRFRNRVMGRGGQDDDAARWYTVTVLNIRSGPGIGHDRLDASPLAKGTICTVLDERGDWRFVAAEGANGAIEGWVHGYYLRRA